MRARIDRARKRSLHDGSDDAQDQFELPGVGNIQESSDCCNDLACLHDGSPFFCFVPMLVHKRDVHLFGENFKNKIDSVTIKRASRLRYADGAVLRTQLLSSIPNRDLI